MRACSANCAYADQAERRITLYESLTALASSMRTYLRRALGAYQESLRYDRIPGTSAASTTSSAVTSSADTLSVTRLSRYYTINPDALPPSVQACVRPLAADEETQDFLNSCKSSWVVSMLAKLLRCFYSVTDTNAMLRRGQMFVISKQHVKELLASVLYPRDAEMGGLHHGAQLPLKMLDIGAGDGGVTSKFEGFMDSITVTEVSKPMGTRLRERGYEVHVTPYITPELFPTPHTYDVVSIFNVLDRCDHPNDLLKAAIRLMKPDTGRLVLAVVLPFSEFVEEGTKRRSVMQPLPMRGARCGDNASFEASLSALITRVLLPLNLEIERLAKVPYLCQGDHNRPYYVLADAIIICRALPAGTVRLPKVTDVPFGAQLLQGGGPLSAAPVKPSLRDTELPPLMHSAELDKTV
jgi:SAM-dependent methyltransferase